MMSTPLRRNLALYSEADFRDAKPEGFRAVQDAFETARQKRVIGMNEEQVRDAARAMQIAVERKSAEQRVAEQRFLAERDAAFDVIAEASAEVARTRLSGWRGKQGEHLIEHATTMYSEKRFGDARAAVAEVQCVLREGVQHRPTNRFVPRPIGSRVAESTSPTSEFYRGHRLEQAGDIAGAVHAYDRVLTLGPGHIQAVAGLKRLGYSEYKVGA